MAIEKQVIVDATSYTPPEAGVVEDPRAIIAREPMGRAQIIVVAICIALTALDGFDVLSISFASPGIAAEWRIDRAMLGIVLSMELIGMCAGSVFVGGLADKIGRRPVILGCLLVMALGMALATTAHDVTSLSEFRLFTGIGIGGMLAASNTVVAEFANAKRRNLAVALMACGYPLGAIVGGSIASRLLVSGSWRSVFAFGAIASAAFLPLVWFLVPETIHYLAHRRPANVLERINAVLRRVGRAAVTALPAPSPDAPRARLVELFTPALARTTVLLTVAYFAHLMTFYFILKWIPKIVVDMGFAPSTAGGVLVWANVGGLIGALTISALTLRVGVRPLVIVAMLCAAVMVTVFGQGQADLTHLSIVAAVAGMCTNGAIVGLYAIVAQSYPSAVRSGGTGFIIGVGRGGAALGPIVAGFLFAHGGGLPSVAMVMALGSLLAAVAILALRYREQHTAA
ncbi:MAG TPA: MFS transporter [Gemmatimonadaceae bacterium]